MLFAISTMTGGVRTRRKNERALVAPHSSGSRVASGFCTKHLRLVCFGRKTRRFWLATKGAAGGFVVVLMLISSGKVITHFLNPRLVPKLSDYSNSRKKKMNFKGLPEIKPTELSRQKEAQGAILSRLTV